MPTFEIKQRTVLIEHFQVEAPNEGAAILLHQGGRSKKTDTYDQGGEWKMRDMDKSPPGDWDQWED